MTRKRFVKLLMAHGYSRNSANRIADATLKDGYSYAEGYDQVTRILPLVKAMTPVVVDAVHTAAEYIGRVARAVCDAASAAIQAFNAVMNET